MVSNWYVVQTHLKNEITAKHNLIKQGYEVFLPLYKGKKEQLLPLFSGYLFVRFDPTTCRWQSIHSTIGVSRILGYGEQTTVPAPCRDNVIPGLQAFCDSQGVVDMALAFPSQNPGVRAFMQGDEVEILEGMFKNHKATYWNRSKAGVHVILSLLNRPIRVILRSDEIQ